MSDKSNDEYPEVAAPAAPPTEPILGQKACLIWPRKWPWSTGTTDRPRPRPVKYRTRQPRLREGFKEGASAVATRDFVEIRDRSDVRLFPEGEFPVQRGRLLSVPDDDRHYLFTTGYAASVGTYQGSNIPSPLEVRPDEHCETPSDQICEEILFLTKLDWNTTALAVKMPVTIKIARKVGRVLSDIDADPDDAQVKYFYYM